MASLQYCINLAAQDKKINKGIKEALEFNLNNNLGATNPEDIIRASVRELSQKKRDVMVDAIRVSDAIAHMESHPGGLGLGLVSLLGKDLTKKAKYGNIDYLQKTYRNRYDAQATEVIEKFKTRFFGFMQGDKEGLGLFIRAMHGEDIGDPKIMKLADDFKQMTENMRVHFNEAGGSISKLDSYVLPQGHDRTRIKNVSKEEYVKFVKARIDPDKMVDDAGKVLSEKDLMKSLEFVYDTFRTDGMNKAQGIFGPTKVSVKLSKKGSEKRFLHFKDGQSWMDYQAKFGKGDIFTTMTDMIDNNAADIALIEVLGSNPANMYQALRKYAEVQSIKRGKEIPQYKLAYYDSVYKVVSGEINGGHLTTAADLNQAWSNLEIAGKLGAAFVASFTDQVTIALAAHTNKMSYVKTLRRSLGNFAKMAAGGGKAERELLSSMGLVIDTVLGRAHSLNRFSDTYGTGITAKLAEGVLRISSLEVWTQANQKGFAMEFSSMLARNFNKKFDDLDFVEVLTSNGITREMWDEFRKTTPLTLRKSKFADLTKDKSTMFHQMVLKEMEYAVPTSDARTQAMTTLGLKRMTGAGQVARSAMMLKNFPITVANNQWTMAMTKQTTGGKAAYLGTFAIGMTVMGSASLMVADVLRGREPREMNGKMWFDSFIRGGAGSLAADLGMADPTKYGRSWIDTAIGPKAGTINDFVKLTAGNVWQAVRGDETNLLREGIEFAEDLTPGAWQAQLLIDSMFDSVKLMTDPKYRRNLRREEKRAKEDYGASYWWKPGATPLEVLEDLQ